MITSSAPRPITLLTWGKPFHPRSGLTQNCFPIWDLTTNTGVPSTVIHINRMPFSRARGSADEQYFLTLYPNVPTVVSTSFGTGNEELRPRPKAAALQEREDAVRNRTARRSVQCGVDGLEPGHRYKVGVARAPLMSFWWVWGTKEELSVERGSQMWGLQHVEREDGILEIGEIEGVEIEVLE